MSGVIHECRFRLLAGCTVGKRLQPRPCLSKSVVSKSVSKIAASAWALGSTSMATEDTRIVLRAGGVHDPIADHPQQPADYVHTDGTVWTWHERWRLVGGVKDDKGWLVDRLLHRLYDRAS